MYHPPWNSKQKNIEKTRENYLAHAFEEGNFCENSTHKDCNQNQGVVKPFKEKRKNQACKSIEHYYCNKVVNENGVVDNKTFDNFSK